MFGDKEREANYNIHNFHCTCTFCLKFPENLYTCHLK